MINKQDQNRLKEIGTELEVLFSEATEKVCGKREAGCGGCCTGCEISKGHFQFEEANIELKEKYGYKPITQGAKEQRAMEYTHAARQIQSIQSRYEWNDKTGFLTEKGCSIPRWERSVLCQEVFCKAMRPYMPTERARQVLGLLRDMESIRKRNELIF